MNARKIKSTAAKLKSVHTHMLLWNLLALENNALYSPLHSIPDAVKQRDWLRTLYRAELASRDVEVPEIGDEGGWEIAKAKALGFDRPQPQRGQSATACGWAAYTKVWSDEDREYVRVYDADVDLSAIGRPVAAPLNGT
jgi:hypothetical protein